MAAPEAAGEISDTPRPTTAVETAPKADPTINAHFWVTGKQNRKSAKDSFRQFTDIFTKLNLSKYLLIEHWHQPHQQLQSQSSKLRYTENTAYTENRYVKY